MPLAIGLLMFMVASANAEADTMTTTLSDGYAKCTNAGGDINCNVGGSSSNQCRVTYPLDTSGLNAYKTPNSECFTYYGGDSLTAGVTW